MTPEMRHVSMPDGRARKRSQVVVVGEDGRVQLADGLCRPRHRASMHPPYELGAPAELNP
jgi:hypothetical protein